MPWLDRCLTVVSEDHDQGPTTRLTAETNEPWSSSYVIMDKLLTMHSPLCTILIKKSISQCFGPRAAVLSLSYGSSRSVVALRCRLTQFNIDILSSMVGGYEAWHSGKYCGSRREAALTQNAKIDTPSQLLVVACRVS